MAQIDTILREEGHNDGSFIRLYSEGIFYKAYERSAWMACRVLHPFMVKKRAVRKVGQEVVSIGFPKTSLQKWAGGRRMEDAGDESVLIHLSEEECVSFDEKEFEDNHARAVALSLPTRRCAKCLLPTSATASCITSTITIPMYFLSAPSSRTATVASKDAVPIGESSGWNTISEPFHGTTLGHVL